MKKTIQKVFLCTIPAFLLLSVLLISSFGIPTYAQDTAPSMEPRNSKSNIRCLDCGLVVSGEVPGGMIQSIEEEDGVLDTGVPPIDPHPENEEKE